MNTPAPLPPPPAVRGRVVDCRLHLLSRQVHDVDRVPISTVDDLELLSVDEHEGDPCGQQIFTVHALLSGAALATRVLGGRAPASRWHRILWAHVADVGTVVRLGVSGRDLDVTWTERWVREHIITRIPGGDHDPQ